jgi:hypothetical protein
MNPVPIPAYSYPLIRFMDQAKKISLDKPPGLVLNMRQFHIDASASGKVSDLRDREK